MKGLTWTVLAAAEDGGGGGTYPAEVEAPEVVPDPVPEDPEVAATGPFSFSSFSTRCSSAKICSFWMICSWRVAPALSCFFNTETKRINNKTMKRKRCLCSTRYQFMMTLTGLDVGLGVKSRFGLVENET